MLAPLTAVCLIAAAQSYGVPAKSLYSILRVEGGELGLAKPNLRQDGSVRTEDLGPFQVNTQWLPALTTYWKFPSQIATYQLLRDDGCVGAYAAAAIIRYHWQRTGSFERAIAYYHTGPKGDPAAMAKYLVRYREVLAGTFGPASSSHH